MSSAPYMMGRPKRAFATGTTADALFASERLDGRTVEDSTFQHCTFANVSFKGTTIKNCVFVDCVFSESYFREAELVDCRFEGCKFLDCDLSKVRLRGSDFKLYSKFKGCHIPFAEMSPNLPHEFNLRAHLCRTLSREAHLAGALGDSGAYRQQAARAWEQQMWRGATGGWGGNSYFRDHYKGRRLNAMAAWLSSKARGYIWGYRRSGVVVFRNAMVLTFGVFPILLMTARKHVIVAGKPLRWGDAFTVSFHSAFRSAPVGDARFTGAWAQAVATLETAIGFVLLALLASLIFRGVFERWR